MGRCMARGRDWRYNSILIIVVNDTYCNSLFYHLMIDSTKSNYNHIIL